MLHHVVLLDVDRPDGAARVATAMDMLSRLAEVLPGASGFEHRPNHDLEGKSKPYGYGFFLCFTDRDAWRAYQDHPEHVEAGAVLVAACRGGADGIFVADLAL